MNEHRILHTIEADSTRLIWPLDGAAEVFAVRADAQAYAAQRIGGVPAIALPGGAWLRYLLSERYDLSALRIVSDGIPDSGADGSPEILARAPLRKRFDTRALRNFMYLAMLGYRRPQPVEARIRPANQVAAELGRATFFRFRSADDSGASGDPPVSFLGTTPDGSKPDTASVERWIGGFTRNAAGYDTSRAAGYDTNRAAGYDTNRAAGSAKSRAAGRPGAFAAEQISGQTLTGTAPILDIRGPSVRLMLPSDFLARMVATGDVGPLDSNAANPNPADSGKTQEWWGRVLFILTMETLKRVYDDEGIARILQLIPFGAQQKSSGPALRFAQSTANLDRTALANLVDHCYRRQSDVDALREVYRAFPPAWQRGIDAVLGPRRREQFVLPFSHRSLLARESIGDRVSEAAAQLVDGLASRTRRRGDAFTASLDRMVRNDYLEPLARGSRKAFETQRDTGALETAMERASLSRLRRVLRTLPREILVNAAVFESRETKTRIAAIYSRRGRRLFFEDLEAREAFITRDARYDFRVVIAARTRVLMIARKIAL